MPDCQARRPGYAHHFFLADTRRHDIVIAECATDFCVSDFQRKLRCQRDQKGFFIFTEKAHFSLLHGDNTQHIALMNNGSAQKSFIIFFVNFGVVFKTRVLVSVLDIERLFPLPYQTNKAFRKADANLINRIRMQTVGGFKDKFLMLIVGQIDGAGVHLHDLFNPASHPEQRLFKRRNLTHFLNNAFKCREHTALASH